MVVRHCLNSTLVEGDEPSLVPARELQKIFKKWTSDSCCQERRSEEGNEEEEEEEGDFNFLAGRQDFTSNKAATISELAVSFSFIK